MMNHPVFLKREVILLSKLCCIVCKPTLMRSIVKLFWFWWLILCFTHLVEMKVAKKAEKLLMGGMSDKFLQREAMRELKISAAMVNHI